MHSTPLHERLSNIVGQRSCRSIGELTDTNHETVRRYLAGQSPSVEFVQAVCKAFGVSGDWMLTGRGPMKAADVKDHALRSAHAGELLAALSEAVEQLISRVDRHAQLMQALEVRLRAVESRIEVNDEQSPGPRTQTRSPDPGAAGGETDGDAGGGAGVGPVRNVEIPSRVLRIRDAFSQRPRSDAGGTPPTPRT